MQEGSPPTDNALSIDIAWLKSANDKATESSHRSPPTSPTIFRVPPSLRCGNNLHDYKPKLVAIGPYLRSKNLDVMEEDLQAMEELKWRMLDHYLSMVPKGRDNEVLRMMKKDEKRARNCYSEVIDMDSDQFMQMLLLDGSFLVQIFITLDGTRAGAPEELKSRIAPELRLLLLGNLWFRGLIIRDMLLLENQLPYFIIQRLLQVLEMEEWNSINLRKVALRSFVDTLPKFPNVPYRRQDEPVFQGADHLLDLFHRWILSIPRTEASETRSSYKWPFELLCSFVSLMLNRTGDCLCKVACYCCNSSHSDKNSVTVPTMTELAEAGVKIEVSKAASFLAISFSMDKGVLKIPDIYVHDETSFLFANLIAFEQCRRIEKMDITHYALFLDDITNTPKDVQLLHQQGIIHRFLGSDEHIASVINGLGNGVVFDSGKNYLQEVCNDLKAYCQKKWPRLRAKAVHYYFNSPWAFMSSVAAALLIVLTILQTIYAIIGYYKNSDQPY